jgi:ABC-2 type transport system ATP-binding protein
MEGTAISTLDLTKKFRDFTAVDHVTLQVKDGEIFGFLGPNGAGKSTTIRLLCTLSMPTSGSATVAGFDVVRYDSEVRKHIGLVSEKLIMYNELTARENLRLFGRLYDIPHSELERRIDELLKFVRMEKWADARIGTFSTGMKQRINVIRALVNRPEILFLDEPTLGLDPQSTVEIRDLVRKINTDLHTTMILTTHTMVDADMLCDRIGIIDKGRIVALDTSPNLKRLVSGTEVTAFDFEVANLTPAISASVRGLGCVVSCSQEEGTHLRIRAKGEDAFDSLIDSLRGNKARIVSARSLEPTLEDVFLHLTGHEVAEKPTTAARPAIPTGRRGIPVPAGRVR